jgi:hypothetical protein
MLMKRFLFFLAFTLLIVTTVAAQCNNGNGYGNNGNGNGNNQGGGGNNNSNGYQAPSGITWQVASKCLLEAAPYFQQQMSLNMGQLVVRYFQGVCTITLVATNPPTNNTYRVSIGGNGTIVVIDNL